MKLNKLFLILSIVAMSIGVGFFIAATILSFLNHTTLSDIFFGVSSILGIIALGLLVYNLAKSSRTIIPEQSNNKPKVVVKIVDVKDLPKTREEQLYEQYEGLYKQGLISKEDLELKRKELLNK